MAFLDWIEARAKDLARLPVKERGETRELFAEWRADYALAKQRDQTGREPERMPVATSEPSTSAVKSTRPKPAKLNDHDIPF